MAVLPSKGPWENQRPTKILRVTIRKTGLHTRRVYRLFLDRLVTAAISFLLGCREFRGLENVRFTVNALARDNYNIQVYTRHS